MSHNLSRFLAAKIISTLFWRGVHALDEQQVGDLYDDFEGVGDAAGPKSISGAVNLIGEVASEHRH